MRSFRFLTLATALAALSVGAPRSNAAPITNLFNTGVDAAGNGLALNFSFPADLHYSVVAAPLGAPAGTTAVVFNAPTGNLPIPPSITNTPGAGRADWISGPNAPASGPVSPTPNGLYDYRTTFTTTDGGIVSISGKLTADDQVTSILINGVVAITTGLPTPDQGYASLFNFSATGVGALNGTNTLDFIVNNTHSVTEGLLVSNLSGNTSFIPEPASIIMLGGGLIGILGLTGLRRMKKVA